MRVVIAGFLLAGCGGGVGPLVGAWGLTQSGATARYSFESNAQFTFEGVGGGITTRLSGAWFANDTTLTLSFDGRGTFDVPYTIADNELTLTDDPATCYEPCVVRYAKK